MCLPLCHKWSNWSDKKETYAQTIREEFPLVFSISILRITQDRVCCNCNKTQSKLIETYEKSKTYVGSYKPRS